MAQGIADDETLGRELHEKFKRAAEGENNGWLRYQVRSTGTFRVTSYVTF